MCMSVAIQDVDVTATGSHDSARMRLLDRAVHYIFCTFYTKKEPHGYYYTQLACDLDEGPTFIEIDQGKSICCKIQDVMRAPQKLKAKISGSPPGGML